MHWQPISTAPKETALLLATEFFGAGDWRIKCGSFYGGEWHVWGASWTPSHWMPLPAAPDAKCRTCSGHGAVGNILTAEPCQDCTPAPVAPGARVLTTEDMEALSLTHGLSGDIEEMAIIVETMVLDRLATVDASFEDRISDWAHGDALDAERYRWLRDEGRVNDFRVEQEKNGWMKTHSRSTLDAAIDAARAAKESP
jgi:hypothetical protein